jgi:hypothetical protein
MAFRKINSDWPFVTDGPLSPFTVGAVDGFYFSGSLASFRS